MKKGRISNALTKPTDMKPSAPNGAEVIITPAPP